MKTIISSSTSGTTKGILEELKKRLHDGDDCTVLTTDRNAANMEKIILDTLTGCGAEFKVNVMSFTRFAVKTLGESIKGCLTPEGSVMLLADVIEKKQREFDYYRRVRPDSLAGEVYAALTALRNSGVSTLDFKEKAKKLPPSLQRKAHDLAIMHEGYLEALMTKRQDSSTRLETLAKYIDDNGDKVDTHFFVVDMHEFNAPQLEVLRALDKSARSLTVGLVSGFDNKNRRIYPEKTIDKVKSVSKNKAVEVVVFGDENLVQRSLQKNLFAYEKLGAKEIVEVGDHLTLKCAVTRQDEVLATAIDIVKKVQKGARYKDFEVLIGSEAYAPIVKNVFERYGINFFIDRKELLMEQTKVKYLLSALDVAIKNFRNEEVLDFVKNPLFVLSLPSDKDGGDMVFRFENYVLEYGVNFGGFLRPFEYGDNEKRADAEEVRQCLVEVMKTFSLDGMRPMSDFTNGARDFLDKVSGPWQAHVEKLSSISEHYKKCAEQVDNKLSAIFEEIENVLGGQCDLEKFDTVVRSMLKTLKIALVPTFLDSVFVGDLSSKFTGEGHLYVLGANSGCLPPDTEGGAVITPKDEELFEEADINIYPTQRQRIRQNLFTITEILSKSKGGLTVSYSVSSPDGELNPSTIIGQFKTMFKKNGAPIEVEHISFDNLRASMTKPSEVSLLFASNKGAKHSVMSYAVSGRAGESDMDLYRTAYKFLSESDKVIVEKIYAVPERIENKPSIKKTSISRLERYFKCPYSYFLNYTLSLKRRDEGEITGLDNGTLLHAVFENFFKALRDGSVDRDSVEALAKDTFDKVVREDEKLSRLSQKPDVGRLLAKLKNEGVKTCKDLYEISLHSKFKPTYLEAEFEKDGTFKPIALDVDGKRVELRGKIDRVDVFEDKFVIIDYKTFKGVDLQVSEIYHGEKLQLYIYAMSITQNIDKKIAGVFYLPVFPGYTKVGQDRYNYVGQVSADEGVRNKIFGPTDEGVTSNFNQATVLPTPSTNPKKASTYLGDEAFMARGKYALDLATEGVREIESGFIAPQPIANSCAKCDFEKICPYREQYPRTKYNVTTEVFLTYDKPIEEASEEEEQDDKTNENNETNPVNNSKAGGEDNVK